jgi:KDO2-lipid IV(A) lauroyltransferase
MHLGNIDLVGQVVASRGFPVTVPVERTKPEALFRRTQRLRQRLGVRSIEASHAPREMLRALAAKEVVAIMADRNVSTTGIELTFFGRTTRVSRGPAWLISKTDAPVFVGSGLRRPDNTFKAEVERLPVQRTGDPQRDEAFNARLVMKAVEARIRNHPEQWAMFVPVWWTGTAREENG